MQSEAESEGFDLTKRQWLIWAEQALAPDLPLNNMAMSAVIEGPIDARRFDRAFGQVVEESEALRTVLILREDSPRRFVRSVSEPVVESIVEHVDLSGSPDPDLAYGRWRDERCRMPFDTERRLFDSVLVRLGPRRFVWYLCQHHIISDAWSFGLIFERTARLYENPATASSPAQAETTQKQLASEKAYLDSDRHRADQLFWTEHFSHPVEPLHPYGIDRSGSGPALRHVSADVGIERSSRLRALLGDDAMRAATPALGVSALFTTALFAYLHRITGSESIGVGIPVQNRPSRWSKNAIGRFAETCPMRVRIEHGETFRSLHAKVAQESFSVLAHARCTLANPVRAKRYDAMLNFHNLSIRPFAGFEVDLDFRTGLGSIPNAAERATATVGGSSSGKEVEAAPPGGKSSEVLTLNVADYSGSGNFRLGFEFNADLFDETLSARAIEHFMRVIDALIDDPGQRIDAASIATSVESAEAQDWPTVLSGIKRSGLDREPQLSLLGLFRKQVATEPGRVAVLTEKGAHSYSEVDSDVRNLSTRLKQSGVAPLDIIGVCIGPSPYWQIVSVLAIHDVGAVCLPLDRRDPAARLNSVLTDAAPKLVLTDSVHDKNPPAIDVAHQCFDIGRQEFADAIEEAGWRDTSSFEKASDELACLVYVSSASGGPIGIEIEHRSLGNFLTSMSRMPGLTKSDRVLALNPDSFDDLLLESFAPLSVGGSVDFTDELIRRDTTRLAERLADPAITLVHAHAETWQALIETGWSGRSDLRVMTKENALSRPLADALLDRTTEVWSLYGAVEGSFVSGVERVRPNQSGIAIGGEIDQTSLHVLTPRLEPVPRGLTGELYVAGVGLARGYRGRPAESSEVFVRPIGQEGLRLFKTGERVRIHLDGRIESLGRFDQQVQMGGLRIALEEVEAAILDFEHVANVVVTAHEVSIPHRQLVAYVEVEKDADFEVKVLEAHLRTLLPGTMVPTDWRIVDALPRIQDGRFDRGGLADSLQDVGVAHHEEPPQGDIEVQIAALFRELLGVAVIARGDDFFDLGGQSLVAVEATRRLGSLLGRKVDLATFFQHSTVAGLAEAIQQSGIGTAATMAVELRPGPVGETLFCVAGVSLYQELANAFSHPLRVYGISVDQEVAWIEAVERGEAPRVSPTQETAREYVATLRRLQPTGPYRLVGLSYGGVLAFEIAQQLLNEGEEVSGLVLLDSRLPGALAKAKGLFGPFRLRFRDFRRAVRLAFWRYPDLLEREKIRDGLFIAASGRYEKEIRAYPGSALLCRALGHRTEEVEFDETLGWGQWIRGVLTLANCPGDHLDLVSSAHAAETAREIERYLGLHEQGPIETP